MSITTVICVLFIAVTFLFIPETSQAREPDPKPVPVRLAPRPLPGMPNPQLDPVRAPIRQDSPASAPNRGATESGEKARVGVIYRGVNTAGSAEKEPLPLEAPSVPKAKERPALRPGQVRVLSHAEVEVLQPAQVRP